MTTPNTRSEGGGSAALGDEQGLPGTEGPEGAEGGAREQIRQARDRVVDQAKSTLQSAKTQAGSTLSQGRRQAADRLGGIGSAFHRTGEQLRGEDQAPFADVADSIGRQVDRVADYLRESDGRTMLRDLEGLARRQPALVFAGAFALGVVAARFLKSSEPDYDQGDASYERIRPGGEPAGLGGGFDAPA
jgi:hypothetical protein